MMMEESGGKETTTWREEAPICNIPQDTLHKIFSLLPLPLLIRCRTLSKFFLNSLSVISPHQQHSLSVLALRPPHHRHVSTDPTLLHAFSPCLDTWIRFPLSSFLPFLSPHPVASSHGLLFLWALPPPTNHKLNNKVLIACNPVTRSYRVLPQLGSAWARHGSVLVGPPNRVIVLTELAALYFSPDLDAWVNFSSNLPSKPRSPILISDSVLALCDVGSPWRSQWKLFSCRLEASGAGNPTRGYPKSSTHPRQSPHTWSRVEKQEWGDVFDILKRPRLVRGVGNRVLMIGGLRSSFSLNSACSTILILRLDLETMEWDEAGRMPQEMFTCFQESSKFKVFGGGERVAFSAKRVGGRLALWENGDWRWIHGVPGSGDGLSRGFLFEARLDALP